MDLTARLVSWADANAARLERLGEFRIERGPDKAGRPFAWIRFRVGEDDVEVLLWSTGDAEFGHGRFGKATQEHRDLTGPEDLRTLVADFDREATALARGRAGGHLA